MKMAPKTKAKESYVECVDCGSRLDLIGEVKMGQGLTCPECGTMMEIVGLDPIEADWIYDEPEYEQDEEQEADW
jgi:DNA-directed RNA polymerase subunit RPC12/RpoP